MLRQLKTWQEFKTLIADNSQPEWIYRGHANSNWTIRSSLCRSGIMINFPEGEERMLYEFQRASRSYLNQNQIPTALIDWFAMLQHYGAPTRLIDFTKSPYVAAFFAFEDSEDYGENISVWIVNKANFCIRSKDYLMRHDFDILDISRQYSFTDNSFKLVFEKSYEDELDCVLPIDSQLMNERCYIQQSVFLAPSNPYKEFNQQLGFLGEHLDQSLINIQIPRSERRNALRDLEKMNITHASLFPGLDGFAKSLKVKFSTLMSLHEVAASVKKLQDEGIMP